MDRKRHKARIVDKLTVAYGRWKPPSLIEEGLYLGNEWNATNIDELRVLGIRHVLNVTKEDDVGYVASPFTDEIIYLRISQPDDHTG